jgi:hypothetical protein
MSNRINWCKGEVMNKLANLVDGGDERARFEAYMRERGEDYLYRRDAKGSERLGEYCRQSVQDQWETWQAARATSPQPVEQTRSLTDDARDAARYRWLKENYFDWAAPGDGDSFDYIALHFEHDMLGRHDSTVDAAIDADMAAAQPASGVVQ